MHIKYLPFQQCTAQASDMEAFLVSEHDRQALEIKVGVFDFPSVTMSGISDCDSSSTVSLKASDGVWPCSRRVSY